MDLADKIARTRALWIAGNAPNQIANKLTRESGGSVTEAQVRTWLRSMDIPERPTRGSAPE